LLVVIGFTLVAVAALGGWLAAGSLTRWRMLERLRDARAETQALTQLLDVWHWRTDAQHHLVWWRPPQGAPASAWAGGNGVNQTLWDRFDTGSAQPLRERMDARALLLDVPVSAAGDARSEWKLRGLPLSDNAGRFAGYVGTARAVDRLVPASADATDAEAFSWTVSHDLRAPVRVVDGFARILKEDYGSALDRIGNDHLDRVLSAAARMNQMIDALLALAQLSTQPIVRQPVDLSQIARYIVDDLRRGQPEREAHVHVEPGLTASGDPTLLRVVLENLLGNAWKYSARSSVTQIRFDHLQRDGRDVFVVRDNGAGFDMRFADRLFGAFQRLHSASDFAGTGIGLASVKRILRRHGGDIWAEAEVGKGASFHFTLAP